MTKHSYISLWEPFLFKPPQYACTGMLCACIGIFVCACVRDRRVGEREKSEWNWGPREVKQQWRGILRTKQAQSPLDTLYSTAYQLQAQAQLLCHTCSLLRAVKMFLLSLRINGFRIAEIVENTTCALMSLFSTKKGCQSLRCHNTSGVLVLWLSYQALVCRQD